MKKEDTILFSNNPQQESTHKNLTKHKICNISKAISYKKQNNCTLQTISPLYEGFCCSCKIKEISTDKFSIFSSFNLRNKIDVVWRLLSDYLYPRKKCIFRTEIVNYINIRNRFNHCYQAESREKEPCRIVQWLILSTMTRTNVVWLEC